MSQRKYYWIIAQDETGKTYLIFGSDQSEELARIKGLEMVGSDFDIKALPTKDMSRASSMLKGNRLETTHNLKKASQRLGHDKSLRRAKRHYISSY
jgi:hypothetical protein